MFQFLDGGQTNSPQLALFNGIKYPHVVVSTGTTLQLQFTTDASVVYPGFHIVWTAIPRKYHAARLTSCVLDLPHFMFVHFCGGFNKWLIN